MLRHVRRHVQDCNSFGKDRDCPSKSKKKCPFWVEGRHGRTRWHQSLRTNDEKTAIRLVNRIIETGRLEFDEPRAAGVTVLQAIEAFLAEQTSRGMADSTLKSFRKFLIGSPNRANCRNPEKFSPTLMEFATDQAIETLTAFVAEPDLVAKFRQRWRVSQTTSLKQTERLKSFFKFAVDMKWITENPARTLRPPVDNDEPPVVPFTKVQVAAILQACGDTEYLRTPPITCGSTAPRPGLGSRLVQSSLPRRVLRMLRIAARARTRTRLNQVRTGSAQPHRGGGLAMLMGSPSRIGLARRHGRFLTLCRVFPGIGWNAAIPAVVGGLLDAQGLQ